MSIERAEELKKQLTDQWVQVTSTAPEHQRFANSVGQVRTVNMNCHALVEFFGDKDDSWYDIAPEFLTVTDQPEAKPVSPVRKQRKPAPTKTESAKTEQGKSDSVKQSSIKATESSSPLAEIRSQSTNVSAAPKAEENQSES